MAIQPIQTYYHGYKFRSRLEARYAVYFDSLKIDYEYELEGFKLDSVLYRTDFYLPDFYLPQFKAWVEIKPNHNMPYSDCQKIARLAGSLAGKREGEICLLIIGTPGKHGMYLIDEDFDPYLCDTDNDALFEFENTHEARISFIEYCEDSCGVHFGVNALNKYPWNKPKWNWELILDRQPLNAEEILLSAVNKARSARFEFGESGGAK